MPAENISPSGESESFFPNIRAFLFYEALSVL